ncbi:MAG: hypothetical protein M1136_01910 [Chloroflexi bacterium]|nr:hypothetical protein [Chloroflexota bacterium]MCL5074395.1 hypothetical protein [Chloroflexota bacterium]
MAITDWIQGALVGVTFLLAVVAFLSLRQQNDQMRKLVMPMPLPDGNWLYPRNAPVGQQKPVALRNIGSGSALQLQWEVDLVVRVSDGPPQPRAHTLITYLEPRETEKLWSTIGPQEGFLIGDGFQLTLWYNDIFGNHYRCVFERRGEAWQKTHQRQERGRLPLRGPNTMGL